MDDGSRRAGMVHAVILRSGAADAAAGATGMAAFMIHLHRVGVKRLDSSEEIVRAPCGGSSSSTANKHFCVLSTYYQLTSVQRARDVSVFEGREGAETRNMGAISLKPTLYNLLSYDKLYGIQFVYVH